MGNNEPERVKTPSPPDGPHFEERSMNSEALWAKVPSNSNRYLETAGPKRCNLSRTWTWVAPGKGACGAVVSRQAAGLQEQYLKEAQALWSQSLQGTPEVKDRRFSGDGWASNPVAAFQRPPTCSTPAR